MSMPVEPGKDCNESFFAELKPNNEGLLVWIPDADFFGELIQNGSLKGKVKKSGQKDILLDTSAMDILELISTNPTAINYKEPLLFRKLD
jgi:hypothetical protein